MSATTTTTTTITTTTTTTFLPHHLLLEGGLGGFGGEGGGAPQHHQTNFHHQFNTSHPDIPWEEEEEGVEGFNTTSTTSFPFLPQLLSGVDNLTLTNLGPHHPNFPSLNTTQHRFNTSSDEDLYQVPTGIVVLLSLFYGSISLVAVVGNAVVMWIVATSRKMHSVTNYFIANLALADIIIGLFSIPFQFQAALLQRWNLPEFMCAFCPFFQTVSVNVSVFTLTAIAVDRYRAILFPLSARPSKFRSKVVIMSIWLFSVTLAVPNALVPRVILRHDPHTGGLKPVCDMEGLDPLLMHTYSHMMVGLQFFVPLLVISFAYLRMGWQLWGSRTPGNAEDARDAHVLRNKKKVIKMLFIVVALFAFCWTPLQSYHILQEVYPDINEYRFINIIWFCCHWLAMSNSCCNPFIYTIYNEKYKREFRRKFQCCYKEEGGVEASDYDRSRNQVSLRVARERLGGENRSFRTEATTVNGSARMAAHRTPGRAHLVSPIRPPATDVPLASRPPPHQQEVHVCAPLLPPSHLHPSSCRGRGWGDTQI